MLKFFRKPTVEERTDTLRADAQAELEEAQWMATVAADKLHFAEANLAYALDRVNRLGPCKPHKQQLSAVITAQVVAEPKQPA